jgi:ABC-2 type transport system permease protein
MNSMTALMKREFLDHKGAMFWAQLVIGALMIIGLVWGAATVSRLDKKSFKFNVGEDVQFTKDGTTTRPDGTTVTQSRRKLEDGREEVTIIVTDKAGKQVSKIVVNRKPGENTAEAESIDINGRDIETPRDALRSLNNMPVEERVQGARALSSGMFAGAGGLPLIVAVLMVPFILLASLFDERQDRSILFWKSLPVSDTKVVVSKLLIGSLLTFAIAFAIGIIVHLVALTSVSTIGASSGVQGVSALWHLPTLLNTWFTWALVVVQYVLWALPVYAWFLLVSATAPRAPFLFAFMIPAAIAMFEGLMSKSSHFAEAFFGRLVGGPMIESLQALSLDFDKLQTPTQFFAVAQGALFKGFMQPSLWIGIAIAAALLYGAIEVRRRKTL